MPRRPYCRPLAVGTLAAALVVSLAGCGSASDASPGHADQRIRVAMLLPLRSGLSPFSDDAFKLSRWSAGETLVTLDADSNPQEALATSWERVNETTWRFEIRDGVQFHDGTDLTPESVVTMLEAATSATPVPRILNGVELTAAVDGSAVVVTTATPDPILPQRMSSPQLIVLAEAAYGADGTVDPTGHGTGPFEIIRFQSATSATLDRFDGYWGKPAIVSGIDVSFVPNGTARAAALRTGQADVVEAIPVGQVPQIEQSLVHEVPMPRTNQLYLNTSSGPFADPAVRAAARDAIDRAMIVANAYEATADEAEGLLGPALGYAAGLRGSAEYQAILDERAEPANVDGVEITIATYTDRSELPEVLVFLEQQLTEAGFVVTQDVREYQYIEADALAGTFDGFVLSRAMVLDSGDPITTFASDFACDGSYNLAQFCSPEVDAAIESAGEFEPGTERQQAIMLAEAAILAEDASIPLLHERVIQGESEGATGVARDPRERALITNESAVSE